MYSKIDKGSLKSDKVFNVPLTNRLIANNNKNLTKNNMYSTRNGLYTIQSQSDESRRSSVSENKRLETGDEKDYYMQKKKNSSSSLENSLGYLP